ncbi:zinc finger, CCHC-type containing protein [Tanacetum coccineum]
MKAQELKTKTSAQTLIYKIFLQRYQVYQGRLLASFQDDAKYEHVGQDTRSQGGKDDQDKQGKDLKISDIKTKSKDNDKGSRSKITKHEGTSLQRIQRPRPQDLNDKSNLIDLTKECHNELTSGEIVSLKILSRTMEVRIAPVAIIDRQLPFEYTITRRSTNVVMALHAQNINHSAFRLMFEREKLSENNFNDWFRQLKLFLRVEKKMYVIEQPLPAAPVADSQAQVLSQWNAVYDAYNDVACLILGTGVERFDLIQTFHACKQEEGKPVAAYVVQMKGYVDQLERLGYMLPHDLIVGLILNGLTKDFAGFVRNYNMHNIGKTIGELHAMLIEYEKGLPKKAETPQVMMIKGGKIQKANKKSLKAKGKGKVNGNGNDKQVYIPKPKNPTPSAKEHPAKDDTCHQCKEVSHWKRNCPVYLAELLKKKKKVGSAS